MYGLVLRCEAYQFIETKYTTLIHPDLFFQSRLKLLLKIENSS
jgi:hypothetical protein